MKSRLPGLLLALLLTSAAHAEPLPGANVESLLVIAREGSPDLRMVRLEAEAARERIDPAGALPDPFLRIELENITRTDTWAEVAGRIKSLYAQYWLTHRALQLARENIELTRQLEKIAQARYAGGLAAQQDAIRAQVERSTMDSELVGMETEYRQQAAFINAMLARNASAPLAEPAALRPLPARLEASALNERLLAKNPQLAIEAARVDGAGKTRDLAYRNRFPDFIVGVQPMQVGDRVDAWTLMLELNVPLQQGTRRSQERESERMLEAAAARKEALGYRLNGELSGAVANLEAARTTEQITRSRLLPQAELTFKAALAGYETGKVDFATLLDAQRQIRNARLALLRAQASQQQRLADIERLLGEDL
jgi:cobalt-zinc-cadmium efflux system outer membrane protein